MADKIPKYSDPTAFAKLQDEIIGFEGVMTQQMARDYMEELDTFFLPELPGNNLRQRYSAIMAGLHHVCGEGLLERVAIDAALELFDGWCLKMGPWVRYKDGPLYYLYAREAFSWYVKKCDYRNDSIEVLKRVDVAMKYFSVFSNRRGQSPVGEAGDKAVFPKLYTDAEDYYKTSPWHTVRRMGEGIEVFVCHDEDQLKPPFDGHYSFPWRWGSVFIYAYGQWILTPSWYTNWDDKVRLKHNINYGQNARIIPGVNDSFQYWLSFLLRPKLSVVEKNPDRIVLRVKSFFGWTLHTRTLEFIFTDTRRLVRIVDTGKGRSLWNGNSANGDVYEFGASQG